MTNDMSDSPKFEVIDRRRMKAEQEEKQTPHTEAEAPEPEPSLPQAPAAGPRLVVPETEHEADAEDAEVPEQVELPPAPSAEETQQQKAAYDAAAQRLDDLIRAQNPGMGPQPAVTFQQLVQQFYVSAMIQMGAGTQEGQRPRVDILGARQTIDLMEILSEKTRGNLSEAEERTLQAVLFEVRMAFMELTSMISLQGLQGPPPGKI